MDPVPAFAPPTCVMARWPFTPALLRNSISSPGRTTYSSSTRPPLTVNDASAGMFQDLLEERDTRRDAPARQIELEIVHAIDDAVAD